MPGSDDQLTATLAGIRDDAEGFIIDPDEDCAEVRVSCLGHNALRLLAAVDALLALADDLVRESETLDAEAEYIAGEHPEAAAVAVLRRERSIAYDECARRFREVITRELTKGEGGDGNRV